jgi:hypothetical protein
VTARETKFRQAAWTYFGYGLVYLAGAAYLTAIGLGARGGVRPRGAWLALFTLTVGALFVGLFPWLILRGARHRGYLWFTRCLAFFLGIRVLGVLQVAWAPTVPAVPLPGGGSVSMALGATVFALVALGTAYMLARAAWDLPP